MFCLRPSIKVLPCKFCHVGKLLLCGFGFRILLPIQMIEIREDKGCRFGECNTVRLPHRGSQAMTDLCETCRGSEIRMDCGIDIDSDFHVCGLGVPGQDHTVESTRAIKFIVDFVEEAVVSIN